LPKNNAYALPVWLLIGITCLALLNGCSRSSERDLTAFVAQLKQKMTSMPQKSILTTLQSPAPVTYNQAANRSPFLSSATTSAGGPIPENAPPVNSYIISSLKFVGTIEQNNSTWAVILTPNNKVYKVTIGDKIGTQYGKIIHIFRDRVEVIEQIKEGNNVTQRLVTLPLRDKD
jgi:type IV pilus assembly protein PilP